MAHRHRQDVESALTDPIVAILATAGPRRATVFATLLQLLRNILKDPANNKFRRLRVSNAAVQRRVLNEPLVLDFLMKLGFQFADEHLVLTADKTQDLARANDQLHASQPALHDAVLRAKHALFLLEEAKKVAAAYAAEDGASDYELDSGHHEGVTRQELREVMRAVAESPGEADDSHSEMSEMMLRAALLDQAEAFTENGVGDGSEWEDTHRTLVARDTDDGEDDAVVARLLQQRHAVASAYTAYQAHQRAAHAPGAAGQIDTGSAGGSTWDTAYEGDNDWDKCDLCMDDIGIGAILPCCHLYCNACIRRWIKTNPTCPNCRMVCTLDDIQLLRPLEGEGTLDTMVRLFQKAANGAGSPRSQLQQSRPDEAQKPNSEVANDDVVAPPEGQQHADDTNRETGTDELD